MADLLLELFSEEIPARMQEDAEVNLTSLFQAGMNKVGIRQRVVATYSTPRRLALLANEIPVMLAASETELKGPKVGAPEAALVGFLKKNNLTQTDLTQRDGVYFAVVKKSGRETAGLIKFVIEEILPSFPWPKSMRWGAHAAVWVRPLHSILCIFDGKVVPVAFGPVKANNFTYGHRFLAPNEAITLLSAEEYEAKLEKAFVIADAEKRKARIREQAKKLAEKNGLRLRADERLLDEVTGLVEWPVALLGSIDKKYMDLPPEVLVSEMRQHQKYFALEDKNGKLADKFIVIANMESADGGKAVVAGNERVLRARLADGRFFWDQDRKKTLDDWAGGLKTVTFHAKLGTVAEKVERVKALAMLLAGPIGADKKLVERAAHLSKADLTTGMVGEFPELQGVMGRYYATAQNEKPEVADAIRDHYKPLGPSDVVPVAPVSACIALADKLDTLISMFAIGEKPTGSKDPFALRRAALGVIRIILENNYRLPLKTYFSAPPARVIALHRAQEKLSQRTEARLHEPIASHRVGKYLAISEVVCEDIDAVVPSNLAEMLHEFLTDRLIVQLKDSGIRHDVIKAVVADGDDDLVRIVARAKALQEFIATDDGANLLAAYKRAVNILKIEEAKDKKTYSGTLPPDAKARSIEDALNKTTGAVESCINEEHFKDAMNVLSTLRKPIDNFFENTLINDPDVKTREENLKILAQVRRDFNWVANFALIEG